MQGGDRTVIIPCPKCGGEIEESVAWFEDAGTFFHTDCQTILHFDLNELLRFEAAAESGAVEGERYLVLRIVPGQWPVVRRCPRR